MITTLFFATSTLDNQHLCSNKNRGNTACKHAEFINVWYDYVRYIYGSSEHIYIIDNGGPIKFNSIFKGTESIEYLDVDEYNYNKDIYVHVKRFDNRLNHGGGVVRGFYEAFKFCVQSKLDFYFVEADALTTINLNEELENFDLLSSNIIEEDNGFIDSSISAIRYNLFIDSIMKVPYLCGYNKLNVFDSLTEDIKTKGICTGKPNYQYYSMVENGPYINFKDYRIKKLIGDWIHDCGKNELKNFIDKTNNKVKSRSAIEYMEAL